MKTTTILTLVLLLPTLAHAQSREDAILQESGQVLREILAIPAKGIPEALLKDAHGIVIVPGLIKGGFVIGIEHGEGALIAKDDAGFWRTPSFIKVTGGSVGWQAGVQSSDLLLVFRNRTSLDRLMRGKFTIGADAAVAAGPIGRQASAATDAQLKAEILSYSRSRGLFAGLAIDGAVIQVDHRATTAYYAPRPGQAPGQFPVAVTNLMNQIIAVAGPGNRPAPESTAASTASDRQAVQRQLAEASTRLLGMLDPQWRQYLALPADIYAPFGVASAESIKRSLDNYGKIAADARYRSLTERREFLETHGLLHRYAALLAPPRAEAMHLPPPPQ